MKPAYQTQAQFSIYPDYARTLPENHPVRTYFDEAEHIRKLLRELELTDARREQQKFINGFNELCEVEKRFARKENQLFPYLEKHGWHGPSNGMWAFHDAIRDQFRGARKTLESQNFADLNYEVRMIGEELERLMGIEEMRLFPNALEMLTAEDWAEMQAGDSEIGWMIKRQPVAPPQPAPARAHAPAATGGSLRLEEGALTPEQVNLLLKIIPVDLTYVDENDRVVFYNRGDERVFPRSPGIIGREVRFCHPPKSVGTVLKILEAFRDGSKNEAEFWINFRGRVIHIRYFAVRDASGAYKGVVEMSQDITEIQKLQGERRLLDWD